MPPLESKLRRDLEKTIVDARNIVVAGVEAKLHELTVHEGKRGVHLSSADADLRNRLRAHGRQIGDRQNSQTGAQKIDRLVQECAYEQWHRMIFVRFLAENELLIEPELNVAVSMEGLQEIAEESGDDPWELGGQFAAKALPAIFRPDDPLLQLKLSRETRIQLESLLEGLPAEVFTADDSLGWVYQFWQSEEKDRVNKEGKKITGQTLPAVTQLFTEHYMVLFLLHNTIGAWHAGKVLAEIPHLAEDAKDEAELRRAVALATEGGYEFEYLRFVKVEAASSRLPKDETQHEAQPQESLECSSTLDFNWFDWKEPVDVLSGNLPHVRQEGVTYFVTFRLANSLPAEKWKQWLSERDLWLNEHPEPHDKQTKAEYFKKFNERIHYWLDQKYGDCALEKYPAAKKIVDDALQHFNNDRYILDEYVVAANHVHVLVTPLGENDLSDVLHSWKSFTANKINQLTGDSGKFWQKESFDHAVRSPESLEHFREYIRNHDKVEAASSRLPAPAQSYADKSLESSSTWRPMGGTFPGWPKTAAELKVLDPSCGSGHFLVAALELLARLRMHEEGLTVKAAVEAVIRDNLFGLEVDPRCTQIAAFNLAMAAWKLAGPATLPPMRNIACSGIPLGNSRDEWMKSLKDALPGLNLGFQWGQLYDMFSNADTLGSLINPQRFFGSALMTDKQLEQITEALSIIISDDRNATDEQLELAAAAQGLTRAAELLCQRYSLVVTNVPYRQSDDFAEQVRTFFAENYDDATADLATVFYSRIDEFLNSGGASAVVLPQGALYKDYYTKFRRRIFGNRQIPILARLGAGAFNEISGEEVKVCLIQSIKAQPDDGDLVYQLIATDAPISLKPHCLRSSNSLALLQEQILVSERSIVSAGESSNEMLLERYARFSNGIQTGDFPRFGRNFWEFQAIANGWEFQLSTVKQSAPYGGREGCLLWEGGCGALHRYVSEKVGKDRVASWIRGLDCKGANGVAISAMGTLKATLYQGELFDDNTVVIIPKLATDLVDLWNFCRKESYNDAVRKVDQSQKVRGALLRIPFDRNLDPADVTVLPDPESDDPTQWLFHGRPEESTAPLQVAVARLLGYRWPAERDSKMRLSQRASALVGRCIELEEFIDDDGIVCIPSVRGEDPAADRLLRLLNACKPQRAGGKPDACAYGSQFGDLDKYLRDNFFQEHCELFHQRPFIWHIWDGHKDGFSALVNYHKLVEAASSRLPVGKNNSQDGSSTVHPGQKLLESLTYSYLGDWITRQEAAVKANESGADARLIAAKELQQKLIAILAGEPPYDIFVRWKPLHEQPIGWTPDINDGVRMNIRPFMAVDLSGGRKGAGVLRLPPKIKWTKDRGKEPKRPIDEYPWFWSNVDAASSRVDYTGKSQDGSSIFTGERWNDLHYTIKTKQAAREKQNENTNG
jgi:REP element-mobilizing transposase RayT